MKKIMIMGVALAAGMSAMAQSVYRKVVADPADWTGVYLIVCEGQRVVFNGAADEAAIDAKGGAAILTDVAISNEEISGTAQLDAAVFTISATEDTDWPWAIQSASGLYIGHKDTLDNGLSTEIEVKNKCKHKLAIDASGNLIATPRYVKSGEYNLQYNKSKDQLRFRYFVPNNKQAVQLYKLVGSDTALPTVTNANRAVKRYENGQMIIIKNNSKYNLLGVKVAE